MQEEHILICEDSDEGILSAIYSAYEWKLDHEHTIIQIGEEENLRLFASYNKVTTEPIKAQKVLRTVRKRFGENAYRVVCGALASVDAKRGQAVYQMIVFGLKGKYRGDLTDCIYHDGVAKAVALSMTVWHEVHRFYEFLRFEELEGGLLFAQIHPKCRILPFLSDHFSNRFPLENFVIYDAVYDNCLIHVVNGEIAIVSGELIRLEKMTKLSEKEKQMQELFGYFCHKISIKERENRKLQQQMLPLRFRDDMIEFGSGKLR